MPAVDNTRSNEYLLALNCNNHVATPGHPGNSVMTPEGAQAKKDQEAAANINKNPACCETATRPCSGARKSASARVFVKSDQPCHGRKAHSVVTLVRSAALQRFR